VPTIHFLNVKQGDCSVIQHYSGNVTVIDVCNAKPVNLAQDIIKVYLASKEQGIDGNFNQKSFPVNPVSYLKSLGISSVFRFILTHPDMDHMDGIKTFFDEFQPINFWDEDNQEEKVFKPTSPFNEDDWKFYKRLRDNKPDTNPKRLTLFAGSTGRYYNRDENSKPGGDGLYILAPTPGIVNEANRTGDYNDCSYVLLYRTNDHRVLFSGDAGDKTWDYILSQYRNDVAYIDLLIAPHHGRKPEGSYKFLDILKPKLTFFGNAPSQQLAYGAWRYRDLPYITNNQAGCMVVFTDSKSMKLYVSHKAFAERLNPLTFYSDLVHAYFCLDFKKSLDDLSMG
jgi:competence protein ComEC